MSWNYLDLKSGAELAEALRDIPAGIKKITLGVADISGRTDAELEALGQAMPWVMEINVDRTDDQLSPTEKSSIAKVRIASTQLRELEQQRTLEQQQSAPEQQQQQQPLALEQQQQPLALEQGAALRPQR